MPTRQIPGEGRRRWFTDDYFDLIVWFREDGGIHGFQLCYGVGTDEHALTWTESEGYGHNRMDTGEGSPLKNRTPILVADGEFQGAGVTRRLEESSRGIDAEVRDFVLEKTRAYGKR
ncbi:MAG: hypothetical protein HUU16_08045 [Candidatus Omnitrophica bacterium]|nr:hypothetical protein [Candidatus Omnitrophota bacterium]